MNIMEIFSRNIFDTLRLLRKKIIHSSSLLKEENVKNPPKTPRKRQFNNWPRGYDNISFMTHEHITKKKRKMNEKTSSSIVKKKRKKKLYLGCATKSKIIEMNAQSLEVVFKNEFIISNPLQLPFFLTITLCDIH